MTPVAIGQPLRPVPAEPWAGSSGEEAETGLVEYTEPGLQLSWPAPGQMSAAHATPFPLSICCFRFS